MKLIIHRGTHEIGGSCVELIGEESRILLDIGIPLVKGNDREKFDFTQYKDLTGPELVEKGILPDLAGVYSWDTYNKKIDGLLISHAHQDHYGFLRYLNKDIPVYLGEAAEKLINLTIQFTSMEGSVKNPYYIKSGQSFECGSFKITPYLMDHSAFDAYAFLIQSEGKDILYSGDFRDHGRKRKAFKWFLYNTPKNIDALLLEGTSFGRKDTELRTEEEIEEEMIEISKRTEGIVLVHQSSQNIDRLVSFYKAARKSDRMFVVDIYTAHVLNTLKDYAKVPYPSRNYSKIKVFYPLFLSQRIVNEGQKEMLNQFAKHKITRGEVAKNAARIMMLVRPSMLSDLKVINSFDQSIYVYSLWQGYLEEEYMKRTLEFLNEKNIEFCHLHTSGHASIDTLRKVVNQVKPKKIIPIHTFYPNKYKIFDGEILNVSDGEVINI